MNDEHKPTVHLPTDPFDKMLSSLIGLPNGAHTPPSTVQIIDFYQHGTQYIVQTVRTEDGGCTAFITLVDAKGSVRVILPQKVLALLDRQRESITTKLRRRHGQRIAEERKAAGLQPGFMQKKAKKGKKSAVSKA